MKFIKKSLLLASLVSMGLISCSDESPWSGSDSEGGINLNFSTDGRVMRQTRADDSSPIIPESNQFSVKLSKSDGTYAKDWKSVEAFNNEKGFPIGDYTLEASYGDIDQEGFYSPCYKGSATVHVSPGAVTDANVVATLANAMVSIRYTDEFKSNFQGYSAAVQTEGHEWQVFAQNESRPVYIAPSEVKLDLTLVNDADEKVTIQPAGFTAVARHHYVITIGVTGNVTSGNLALDIEFDEDVVSETVNVPLGDELFSAPAPTVVAKGFSPEVAIEAFEYATRSEKAQFHIFSYGGLKKAYINVEGDYTPAFGRCVQLIGADELTQRQLLDEGVDCAGLFKNPDKMGVIDVSKFLENLAPGTYKVQVYAVDPLTRQSDPVELKATINPITMELADPASVDFYTDEVTVQVVSNCPDIKDKVNFQVSNAIGQLVEATIKSAAPASAPKTRADGYTFNYTLAIEPQKFSTIKVVAKLGTRHTSEKGVPVNAPDYTITPDAFSNRVVLKIVGKTPEVTKFILDNLSFVNGNKEIPTVDVKTTSDGYITIYGLNDATTYSDIQAIVADQASFKKTVPEFTTEAKTQLANGKFSELSNEINITDINAGGQYKYGRTTMINKSSIKADIPTGWCSINKKTCFSGSNPQNTWFMVPSTMASSGEVLIRSVAYDYHGTMPALDNHGLEVRAKYSRNAPASFSSYSAGELFLGSYSYTTEGESRVDGVSFGSRPSYLTFEYKYLPVNNEKGEVIFSVVDASDNIISTATKDLTLKTSKEKETIQLNYPVSTFGMKPARLIICFKSTKGESVSAPVPSDLQDVTNTTSLSGQTIATNAYKSLCVGSQLWVSNLELHYDESTTPSSAPARKTRR